jgi:ABC-2 type transport system permease protein
MVKYFLSENLKIKNTFLNKLIWIMPILTIILTILLEPTDFQHASYNFWYALILPGAVSLNFTLLSRVDGSMKNKGVLSLPLDLRKVWLAKVLGGIKSMSISCIIICLAAQLCPIVTSIKLEKNIPFFVGLAAIIILVITYAWQVPLCIYLGNKIGLFQTVLINIVVNIAFTILAVENFWWAIPFTYPARLMCPVLKILPNGLPAEPGSKTFTPELLNIWDIPFGLSISIVLFFVITYLTAKWYKTQEVL